MTPTIRPVAESDTEALIALEAQLFGSDAWSPEVFRAELAHPTSFYLVLEDDGHVVGYGGLRVVGSGQPGDIQTLAVAPDYRGSGWGRAILDHLLDQSRQRGVTELFLEVRADNPVANALYQSAGFEEIGRRERYYQPDNVDAVVMQRIEPAEDSESTPEDTDSVMPNAESSLPLVLGIETSCDETSVGIVRGDQLLANVVSSSMDQHRRFGGVVPEVAARAHVEALPQVLQEAMDRAEVTVDDIDAIAVTSGPGLAGALMVGVGAAKGLAAALDRPLYAVNHLVGHVAVELLRSEGRELELPCVALLVSGGHTSLLVIRDLVSDVELLGDTIDDAAGEAFDKVARLIGLPYPGGPEIDRVAVDGNPSAYHFPRGLTQHKDQATHRFNFSFSGLKTAVARWWEKNGEVDNPGLIADVAASFQEAVADVLTAKAIDACNEYGVPRLVLGGGVAANSRVRALAQQRCDEAGIDLRIPPLSLCTDNGAMIAVLGAELIRRGRPPSSPDVAAQSTVSAVSAQLGIDQLSAEDTPRSTPAVDGSEEPAPTGEPVDADSEQLELIDQAITGLQPTVNASTTRSRAPRNPWLPNVSLSLGILGLALSPALGLGVVPAIVAVVTGHIAKPHPRARRGTVVVGLILGYLGIAVSVVVGILAATPLVRALLVSAGFLLPEG